MPRSLVKSSPSLKPPTELTQFFNDPPLALNEKREDYENLFAAIAGAAKPADAIAWLLVRDFTDLSWEIQREKNLKRKLIEKAEERAVADLHTPDKPDWAESLDEDDSLIPGRDEAREMARGWAKNPKVRRDTDHRLAEKGYKPMDILSKALCPVSQIDRLAHQINGIDRRIASYEQRRYMLLRTIEQYSDKLARRVEAAPIIDAQYTVAAE